MDKGLSKRLAAAWGRQLHGLPGHTYIDWAVTRADAPELTALATRVVMHGPRAAYAVVHIAVPLWTALRTTSATLRVPHIVVAEFDDVVLFRVWPPVSGMLYPAQMVEDFAVVSVPLEGESWTPVT